MFDVHQLTGFQRDLLYCAASLDDPYGLEIGREVEQYSSLELNNGRLYQNLNTLAERGLIKKKRKNDRTILYMITSEAEKIIENRQKWEDRKLEEAGIEVN
jgi:DNA-binding PadR family transcriptional regulator